MLHFIYGRTASGKSDLLYAKASESARSRQVFFIVPDREAVTAERKCAELDGGENIDVVTFSRLVNYIFRKKGAFVIWANPFCAYGLGNYVQRRGLAAAVAAAKYGYRLKFKLFQPLFRKDGKGVSRLVACSL